MASEEFIHLQHSDSVVANMSATIFSGLIQTLELNTDNEDALIERALSIAIKLAQSAEKRIKSDEEWVKKESGSSFLAG